MSARPFRPEEDPSGAVILWTVAAVVAAAFVFGLLYGATWPVP